MRLRVITCVCVIGLSSTAIARTTSVAEFFVDQQSLRGQRITVEGDVLCFNGSCRLEDEGDDFANSISFSWNRLPREDRIRLAHCVTIGAANCHVVVAGVVPAEVTEDTMKSMASGNLGSIGQAIDDITDDLIVDSIRW